MANRYRDIQHSKTSDGVEYINNPIYPDIPLSDQDYYVIGSKYLDSIVREPHSGDLHAIYTILRT